MRPDPEMTLVCDCQGSLGIGLEVAQGSFAVVGSRQKVLAARCRFELIVRRWVLEFRKWTCRGHRNSRAPTYPAPVLKSLTPLQGNRKRAGALRQHVRFGSKADMCNAKGHVRFTPNSDRESGLPAKVMSALPSKADMCGATREVRFGPKADILITGHACDDTAERTLANLSPC